MPSRKEGGEGETMMSSAQKMMSACVLQKKGNVVMEQLPVPTPGHDELLVKIHKSGVCRTDVHMSEGLLDKFCRHKPRLVLGHEGVGEITELGQGVTDEIGMELKVGDRIGIPWVGKTCRNCDMCVKGKETLCHNIRNTGCTVNGTYAEYATVSAPHAIPIPENLSSEQAAPLLCAGVTAYVGLKRAKVKPNQFVGIMGAAGGVGHLCVQYAKAMGIKVVAIDHTKEKTDFCKSLGADFSFNCTDWQDTWNSVMALSKGGLHGLIVVAPHEKAYQNAFELARPGATIVCIATPSKPVNLPLQDMIYKQLRVVGSLTGTRQDCKDALQYAADGLVKCRLTEKQLSDGPNMINTQELTKYEGRVVLDCTHGLKEGKSSEGKS